MSELLKPEADATVKASREERRVLVSDVHVVYPYASDACRQCGKQLSRHNPHVICFVCIREVQKDLDPLNLKSNRELLDERRPRNRRCPSVGSINARVMELAVSRGPRMGGHRPQNGHN